MYCVKVCFCCGCQGGHVGQNRLPHAASHSTKKKSLSFSHYFHPASHRDRKKKIIKKNKGEVPNGWPALRPRRPCGPGGATSWTVVPPASKRPRCPRGLRTSSDGSNRCFTPRSLSQPTPSPTTTQQTCRSSAHPPTYVLLDVYILKIL